MSRTSSAARSGLTCPVAIRSAEKYVIAMSISCRICAHTSAAAGSAAAASRASSCTGDTAVFFNGAMVFDGDAPRTVPGRGPDWRLAVVASGQARVIENWDVSGLRGTGSHDGPLWRFPFFTFAGTLFAGIPLGIARRALDEFTAFASAKVRPPGPGPITEDGDVQLALTSAEGRLRSARAFVFDALGSLWDTALAGDVPDVRLRGQFLLSTQQAMRASLSAVNIAFGYAGAGALHADQPMQRCFRDLHAAAQHIYFSAEASKRYAKLRFGIEQQTFWF